MLNRAQAFFSLILLCTSLMSPSVGAQLVETQGWFSRKQTTYTFEMAEGREVEYVFNAHPGHPSPDLIRLRVDGKLTSESSALRIEGVMIPVGGEAILKKLPRTVRSIPTRTGSRLILKDYSEKDRQLLQAESFFATREDEHAIRDSLGVGMLATFVVTHQAPLRGVWDYADFDELYNENEVFRHEMDLQPERLVFLGVREKFADVAAVKHVSRNRKATRSFAVSFSDVDETTYEMSGKFIPPNEFHNLVHHSQLEPGAGAVVAVGTIRAFNTAALLKRDLLVCFDYSQAINEANRALIDLIGNLNREDFLREIVGVASGDVSSRIAYAALIDKELHKGVAAFKTEAGDRLADLLPGPPPGIHGQSMWRMWLLSLRQFTASDELWNSTFFSREEPYAHLQTLVRTERAWVVNASLSGATGLKRLGDKIRERGSFVRELDVSNALEHVLSYQGTRGLRAFTENVASLPMDSNSKMLITIDSGKHVPDWAGELAVDKWIYLVRPLADETSKIEIAARHSTLSDLHLNVELIGTRGLHAAEGTPQKACADLFHAM